MFYWYSIFYVFLTIIIGQLITDKNIKVIFFAVMFLLYISCYNIFITFKYYVKLRNNPGIKGDRGDPGVGGQKGSDGVCSMAKNCGISNCRKLIKDTIADTFPEYKIILNKQSQNLELNTKQKKQLRHINTYIDILIPQCEIFDPDSSDPIKDFRKIIKNTIAN
jgi:hypothetical protein